MKASSERRARYRRTIPLTPVTLTPKKRALLISVADYGVISLPQLARRTELSQKAARRHLRELFDEGLVEVLPLARAALLPLGVAEPEAVFGSAPNVYTLTRPGERLLSDLGLAGESRLLSVRSGLFLAHALAVREVRLFFELAARQHPPQALTVWRDGGAAEIDLKRPSPPRLLRPDAWFTYRLAEQVLVGMLEVDRGTERGSLRWKEKLAAYEALFRSGRLREVTGYMNARILVIAPDVRRRAALSEFIATASPTLSPRVWLAEAAILEEPDLTLSVWQQPGSALLKPLLPKEAPR